MAEKHTYGISTTINLPFDAAVPKVVEALKEQGFGVLTEIDVQATLKKKLEVEFRKYLILGACNPHLAFRALEAELELGLLLPCNVIVYEADNGQTVVSVVDPLTMVEATKNEKLQEIAAEATTRLTQALSSLEAVAA